MNRLLVFLLREGLGSVAGIQIRKAARTLAGQVAYYATLSIFAVAAIVFLYVLIYEALSRVLTSEGAAAVLFGANLAVAGIMLLLRGNRRSRPVPTLQDALSSPALEAGVAIGRRLNARLRRIAPPLVVGAAVIGVAIGVVPGILRRREARKQDALDAKAIRRRNRAKA
jgi:hypothetical protein